MMDQPLPPVLGDGVPYVAGMPLWDPYGNPAKPHIVNGPLEYFPGVGSGCGYFLNGLGLTMFFASRKGWARFARQCVLGEIEKAKRTVSLAHQVLDAAESRLAELDREIG